MVQAPHASSVPLSLTLSSLALLFLFPIIRHTFFTLMFDALHSLILMCWNLWWFCF